MCFDEVLLGSGDKTGPGEGKSPSPADPTYTTVVRPSESESFSLGDSAPVTLALQFLSAVISQLALNLLKANINLAFQKGISLQDRKDIFVFDVNAGLPLAMFENDFVDQTSETGCDTKADIAKFSFLRVARGLRSVTGLHDEFSCLFQKGVPRAGQCHTPLVTNKENHTQVFFQLTDFADSEEAVQCAGAPRPC